jgi:hypothetical protein
MNNTEKRVANNISLLNYHYPPVNLTGTIGVYLIIFIPF